VIETINILSGGDIYQLPYETVKTILRNHSMEARKKGRVNHCMTNTPSSSTSIKPEIGNMLGYFKSEMLHTFELQMETMQIKRKQEEEEKCLAILCHRCIRKHPRNECPLNLIEVFLVCEDNHAIDKCPLLPRLKFVYQGEEVGPKKLCFIKQRRSQGPR